MPTDVPRGNIGPFALRQRVGHGGMGDVWAATHPVDGGPDLLVAVKVWKAAPTAGGSIGATFQRELQAIAALDHPRIVRIYDHGLTDADGDGSVVPAGAPYLVMEYVSGGTLATRLGKADFPEQRALLLSLLDGLAHAHARRVVHQDIKPSNVLLAEDGPKLADFGVARALDRDGDRRGDELVLGTPGYMAPEQIRGDAGAIGPWTDLYAVGVLAFTLASGVLPFPRGATPGETMRAQLLGTMRPLVPVGAVPTGFEAWVRRLLDRDPRRRPELAAHAARALLELGPSEPKRGRRRKEHPRSTDGDGATQPIRTLRDRAKLDATTAPEPWPPPPPDWPADREIAEPRYVGAGLGGDDRTPSARRGIHPHAGGATARIVW